MTMMSQLLKNTFDFIFISKVNNKNFNSFFNKGLSIINLLTLIPNRILLGLRHPIYFKRIIKNPLTIIRRSIKCFCFFVDLWTFDFQDLLSELESRALG